MMTLHQSSSLHSSLNPLASPTYGLGPPAVPSTTSMPHPSPTLSVRRPSPRKASIYPGPPVSASPFTSPRFSPLTPIMASPSLTPEPGPGSREGMDVGVPVDRSGVVNSNDWIDAKDVMIDNAQYEVDGVPLAGSSGDSHEAHSILSVAPEGLSTPFDSRGGASVVDRGHVEACPSLPSDMQDLYTIPRSLVPIGLPPAAPKGASATPMWTSTPPTPPQIPETILDTIFPTDRSSISRAHVGASRGGRKRRLNQPRPASVFVSFSNHPTSVPCSALSSSMTRSKTVSHRTPSASMSIDPQRRRSLPPNFGKPLPPLPPTIAVSSVTVSPSRSSDTTFHSQLSTSSSSSESAPSRSRSWSRTRRGLDLETLHSGEGTMLPPSLSRHPDKLKCRTAPAGTVEVRDPRAVQSNGGCVSLPATSDSMSSFKTAQSFSTPTSPVRSPPAKKVFTLEGSVSTCEEGEEDIVRGRKVEREIATNVDEMKRLRRFHALIELLKTEVGYLMDLRALVSVYLAQLSNFVVTIPPISPSRASPSSISISTLGLTRSFPSSRSSFIAAPQASCSFSGVGPPIMGADIYKGPTVRSETETLRENSKLHPDSGRDAKKAHESKRSLLSESEMRLVVRNAAELLALHERFVIELRETVGPLGYDAIFTRLDDDTLIGQDAQVDYWTTAITVDDAVNAAAGVFARQSSSFGIYEYFCPKHNEAADIIRNAQDQHTVEWDAFERRCSLLIASAFEFAVSRPLRKSMEDAEMEDPSTPELVKQARRHSTPLLSSSTSATLSSTLAPAVTTTDFTETRKRKRSGGDRTLTHMPSQLGRLKFVDYMIKPVQRICKYPLLLDQLMSTSSGDAGVAAEKACAAMRSIVGLVDMASMRQAHSVKSALIVSRIGPSLPLQPSRSASPPSPVHRFSDERPVSLTTEFLSSLGACFLSGALDIVQYPSTRARYLGSFLYVGGYMVMVKITKSGKVYEPKFWFPLAGFELIDDADDDVFPYSFHLCGHGHFLQFAAACHQEKEIWMAAIQDATSTAPEWKNEPQSSLPDTVPATSPGDEQQNHEFTATPLPTILSLSELEGSDSVVPSSAVKSQTRPYKTIPKLDASALRYDGQTSTLALSRRSSTASVKAFFAPLSFDISSRIARPSSQVRQQVDQALHDVFSDNCLTVRSQALMREEELFQVRRKITAAVSRSNSGLSLTSAMKRRYDSVLVSSRRRSSMDGNGIETVSDSETNKNAQITVSRRSKTVGIKRRHHPSLSLVPSEGPVLAEADTPASSPDVLPDSAAPLSNCSSATSSNIGSMIPSPLDGSIALPLPIPGSSRQSETLPARANDYRPKRTRSMVDNVRYLFHSRSLSPTPPSTGHPSTRSAVNTLEPDSGGLVHWWRRGSLRRRAQSSPEVPSDDSPGTTLSQTSDDQQSSRADEYPPQCDSRPTYSNPLDTGECQTTLPPTPRRVAFKDSMHHRRRSSYVTSRPDVKPPVRSDSVPSTPRKTLKSVLFFRSSSFTPLDRR